MAKSSSTDNMRKKTWRERSFYTYDCKEASTESLMERLKHLTKNRFVTGSNHDLIAKQLSTVKAELNRRKISEKRNVE